MTRFILILLLFYTTILHCEILDIDEKTKRYHILSSSKIYIDKTRKLTLDDITTKNIKFSNNDKNLLGFGYSPDFDVWIKFTLKNQSDKVINKILEYGNSMTTDVTFYDIKNYTKIKDGLLNISEKRNTINPVFKITLEPYETQTYYIKASSYVTTMIIKLNLWDSNSFYTQEIKHQIILALFFGAMLVLVVYNLFIYIFSKDISYLFYVLYVLGLIIHQLMYVGMGSLYLLNTEEVNTVVQFASLVTLMPIMALAFFIKFFLNIKQYPLLNNILNILIIITIVFVFIFNFTNIYNGYRNIIPIILAFYLVYITVYAVLRKNRQAYFIFIGWVLIFIVTTLMYLSSLGVFNIHEHFPYLIEMAFSIEAILFSIALTDKINTLQKDKFTANQELLDQRRTENERLEIQVEEKTKDLQVSLEEKTLLLQELNHRVKNNMQMIVSLIRLQTNDIDDKKIQALFITTQNRLNAMSQLHELLYQKEDISYINAYEYFTTLIEGLEETYTQDINITYKIDTDLETEEAISCGIILNELVTNSLKYAFKNDKKANKNINISLLKKDDLYILEVEDNGIGYDQENTAKSFGLILVSTLVESKLQGSLSIDSKSGVKTTIKWGEIYE